MEKYKVKAYVRRNTLEVSNITMVKMERFCITPVGARVFSEFSKELIWANKRKQLFIQHTVKP